MRQLRAVSTRQLFSAWRNPDLPRCNPPKKFSEQPYANMVRVEHMTTRILGIESSCDETAAAIVADGREILSSVVASQVEIHRKYGGVVPELASREHLRAIVPVVREALEEAKLSLADIDAVGVTCGPGLIGSLLVGLTYGKVLAMSLGKPLVAVNHLEGHVYAVLLQAHLDSRAPGMPAVCLIVSGGHTVLYEVKSEPLPAGAARMSGIPAASRFIYSRIGQTRDDAAGEAYDKVAKILALGYPGGPVVDQLAAHGNPDAIRFTTPVTKGNAFDFSFSGIKTAVLRHVRAHPEMEPEISVREAALARGERKAEQIRPLCSAATLDLVASFQKSVASDLVSRSLSAAEHLGVRSVLVSGGVAANSELRRRFDEQGKRAGVDVFFPSRALSTDNAAMIAAAAYSRLLAGQLADNQLNAEANLPLA
jgi:N6-L-threonylcarbamoyladenine synthase